MARYVKIVSLWGSPGAVFPRVRAYLEQEGFVYQNFEGELLFQKGLYSGKTPAFIKISFKENTGRVEAWMREAASPGVLLGEYGLEGFGDGLGAEPLTRCVGVVEQLLSCVDAVVPVSQRRNSGIQPPANPRPVQPPTAGYVTQPAPGYSPVQYVRPGYYVPPAYPPRPGYVAPVQYVPVVSHRPVVWMHCPACGRQVAVGNRFCDRCGRPLPQMRY